MHISNMVLVLYNLIMTFNISRRWQAPGAVKKEGKKSPIAKHPNNLASAYCLYMFLTVQSKKPNLRRRLNHVPINQIV